MIYLLFVCFALNAQSSVILQTHNNHQYDWTISLNLDEKDAFYADYFDVTADHPAIHINSWTVAQATHDQYDTTFKQTKKIIDTPVTINVKSSITQFPTNAHFHVTYHRRSQPTIEHEMIPIINPSPTHHTSQLLQNGQYSLIKHQTNFYSPPPIAIMIALLVTILTACYCLKRSRNFYGIFLIACAVFLMFQFIKSILLYKKIEHRVSYTLHSQRKPKK